MPNLYSTSLNGLQAFQRALATTGHNIANANTEGYSRQRVDLVSRAPIATGEGYFGRGVTIAGVERIEDRFLSAQVQNAASGSGRASAFHALSSRVDNLLADEFGGLDTALQGLFDAVQDVANDPSSIPARQVLLSEGETLVDRFDFLNRQLGTLASDVNASVTGQVSEINDLAVSIAELNEAIAIDTARLGGRQVPNDLLDQRQQRVNELADLVSVDVVPQDNGALNVFVGNGQALVTGFSARSLEVLPSPADSEQLEIGYNTGNGVVRIQNQLNGGSLGGTLDFRREVLGSARNELGRLAAVLTDTFNEQHRSGIDLSGDFGESFFSEPEPAVIHNLNNTGSATVVVDVTDTTRLTASDYTLAFDGAVFSLTRVSDSVSVSGPGPLTLDGFDVDVSAGANAGDTFLIRPTGGGRSSIALQVTDPAGIAAAAPVRTSAQTGNVGGGEIQSVQLVDSTHPDLLDTVEIRFNNPPNTFDVVNVSQGVTIAGSVPYTSGASISFNGLQTAITGDSLAGDVFAVSRNTGASADNRNALFLQDLQSRGVVGGTASLQEGYATLVSDVGATTRRAGIGNDVQAKFLEQAREARDSVSGVNLDEEAVNLARFQQAYQASAQVIATADSLFQTLLSAIQR